MSLPVIPTVPMPETKLLRQSPVPKSADKDFPRSLQSAVKEPRSSSPDPVDRRSRSEQSAEAPRREVAPRENSEPVSEGAPTPTREADSTIVESELNSGELIPTLQESSKPAEQTAESTSAVALVVEAADTQNLEIDLTGTQLESGDLALSFSTVAEITEDEMLSQASVFDLKGLAQFLDAVPTKSSDTVQSLAEIVAQFLADGPETEADEVVGEGFESLPRPDEEITDATSELLIATADSAVVDVGTAGVMTADSAVVDVGTVGVVTADSAVAPAPAEVPSALSDGPALVSDEAGGVAAAELSEASAVEPEVLVSESSAVVAEAAGLIQTPSDQPASGVQSPENQSTQTVRAQGASETPSSMGQDDPQSDFEDQSQDPAKPQAIASQAPETSRPGSDVTQQVRLDQPATQQLAGETQRSGGVTESIGRAAQRLVERIEVLRNAPPPRSMVLELRELEGTRVRVSLDGNTVRMTVLGGSLDSDAREQLDRELNQALAQQGFDLARDSEEQRERWEQAQDQVETAVSTQRPLRTPQATGLRL